MDANPSSPPRIIADRYELERELGRGGAATVYLARDRARGAAVAAKVLRPELAHAVGRERFLREIRIASQLTHPHIVPIVGAGDAAGWLWYVMPHIGGGTLRARLAEEPQLAIEEATRVAAQAGEALAYAHARGVVHRDIKPENILLDGGNAFLADFGIARVLDATVAERLTSSGLAIGTPAYMSPEQASGAAQVDGRSDVYSLGCVLYECLAGVPPFVGPTPASVIAQRFAHAPWPLRSYRATLPERLQLTVERAMAMVPADRISAEELARELRGPGVREAPIAVREAPSETPWSLPRRWRAPPTCRPVTRRRPRARRGSNPHLDASGRR